MKYGKLSALVAVCVVIHGSSCCRRIRFCLFFCNVIGQEIDISLVSESLSIVERGTDSIEIIIKTNKSSAYDPEVSCAGGRLVIIQRNGRLPVGISG